jgi:hypothetical protein
MSISSSFSLLIREPSSLGFDTKCFLKGFLGGGLNKVIQSFKPYDLILVHYFKFKGTFGLDSKIEFSSTCTIQTSQDWRLYV